MEVHQRNLGCSIGRWRTVGAGRHSHDAGERGAGILEVVFATSILAVAAAGLLATFSFSVVQARGHGKIASTTADLSRDKMEQLLTLDFVDGATDTTRYPVVATGGTGLGGTMAGNTVVGGISPSAPVASYVDYLDASGSLLPSSASAFYTRQWQISTDVTGTIKTITVVTTAAASGGAGGRPPSTMLVSAKAALR